MRANWRVLPVGPSDSDTGLSHTSHLRTHSGDHAIKPSLLIGESDPAAGGDSYLAGEAGNAENPSPNKGLLLPYIRDTKKRWCLRSVIYLIRLNYNVEVKTLQDGESPYSEIPSPKGRLDDQGRLKRCLLHGTKSKTIHHLFL